jgi:membrane-associated phospholipid phosphatase
VRAASQYVTAGIPENRNNGDEDRYSNKIGNFTKGLHHNSVGEVDVNAYQRLLDALQSGSPAAFENIPLGCSRKFTNPQAGLAFDTEGFDSQLLEIGPAPEFAGDEQGAEIVENYWMALLRDVPFEDYPGNSIAANAASELNSLSQFTGPRDPSSGSVEPSTLFRGLTAGDLIGPYLSQFLVKPVPFGAQGWEQTMTTVQANQDFVTDPGTFINIQNGCEPSVSLTFASTPVHIRNGRDLSQWVHVDVLFQAYFNACLILLNGDIHNNPVQGGIGAKLDPGNPYLHSHTQLGFGTFGGPAIIAVLCEVATRALKAIWFQKWFVHRRLRPEAYAGYLHFTKTGAASFPVNAQALNSQAAAEVNTAHGSYLLPLAFPEGSPTHPSYGAGHATVAGACVTILKALFDEDQTIPSPQFVDGSGTLQPWVGTALKVGDELNKLASNIAIGRNLAGVHWRSDATASLRLGEQIAIGVLRDHKLIYNETFGGYQLTTFSGAKITI